MVEITGEEALRDWLSYRRRPDVVSIAARSALRDLITRDFDSDNIELSQDALGSLLSRFGSGALCWQAGRTRIQTLHEMVLDHFSVSTASFIASLNAVVQNAKALSSENTDSYADASDATYRFGIRAATLSGQNQFHDNFWSSISKDVAALEDGLSAEQLLDRPLWIDAADFPERLRNSWKRLKQHLLAREGEDWAVWTDWYDARLRGGGYINPDLETARILIPEEMWKQGPKVVNAEIRRLIDQYTTEPAQFRDAGRFRERDRRIDADDLAGADEVSDDPTAQSLHAEARRALTQIGSESAMQNNALMASSLPQTGDEALEALGDSPATVSPHLLILRTGALENALVADDERLADQDPYQPPLDTETRRLLRNAIDALGMFIRLDPHLANMQRVLRDEPDVELRKDEILDLARSAREHDAITPEAEARVKEAVAGGGKSAWRTALNFIVVGGKIATAAAVGGIAIARWMIADEAKIVALVQTYYPEYLPWLQGVFETLKTLPLGG